MAAPDLRTRLERLRQARGDLEKGTNSIKPPVPRTGNGSHHAARIAEREAVNDRIHEGLISRGWVKKAEYVYSLKTVKENLLKPLISNFLYHERDSSNASSEVTPAEKFIFYDCETTGVSGGAGTVIFLCGFGYVTSAGFEIIQYLMTDFPGEPEFLNLLKGFVSPERIYVSYNGKSFDSNLMKSRFLLNGINAKFGYQLDLLYPARRLWKRITGTCSLGDIERGILNKQRTDDVPGFLVPDYYFNFIKTGNFDFMKDIAAHHLEDIASLMEVLAITERLYRIPAGQAETDIGIRYDLNGLARMLIERGDTRGAELYEQSFRDGSRKAGRMLGFYYKSVKNYVEALRVWKELWNRWRSIEAAVEIAKYYEHTEKDPQKALRITQEILNLEHIRIKKYLPELRHRQKRLERKTAS